LSCFPIDRVAQARADQCAVLDFTVSIGDVDITLCEDVDRPGVDTTFLRTSFYFTLCFDEAVEVWTRRHELRRHHAAYHRFTRLKDDPVFFNLVVITTSSEIAPDLFERAICQAFEHQVRNFRSSIFRAFALPLGSIIS